jgi:hypothetical protein
MTSDESPEAVEIEKFRAEQQQFYALVGHCILRFQHVEDYLEDIFAAVLGGSRARADAIFASVRGIDRKIQIISAAAVGLQGEPWTQLLPLLNRAKKASDIRGQIAHANPVRHGGSVRIKVRRDGDRIVETVGIERVEDARFELHKRAKETTIFAVDDLRREYGIIDQIFGDMIAFVKAIGESAAKAPGPMDQS